MARLWSCGFELNSDTSNMEYTANTGTGGVSTLQAHTAATSYRAHPTASTGFGRYDFSTAGSTITFARTWIYIATGMSATQPIFRFTGTTVAVEVSIRLTTTNTFQLWQDTGTPAQLGSDSSSVTTAGWHYIELGVDSTTIASSAITGRLDGTQFASGTVNLTTPGKPLSIGWGVITSTTADLYFDDIAVNDSTTGGAQTSFPGNSSLAICRPNAAGDTNAFTTQTGGTAGSTNNFTRVNEVTPNDATSFNGLAASTGNIGLSDLFNVDISSVPTNATVNVVHVGIRQNNNIASSSAKLGVLIEKASGGTINASTSIVNNSTTWRTNASTAPFAYPITLYQDPNGSNWNPATWTPQIGYNVAATSNTASLVQVSNIWMYVDYTPVTNTSVTPGNATLTTATFAPSIAVTANQSVTPGIATLITSTFVPTIVVSNPQTVTPGNATLALTTFIPVVNATNNQFVTPPIATLSLTTFVPVITVTANQTVVPGVATLTLTTFIPTITTTAGLTVIPGNASLTTTTFAPTVTATANQTVTPGTLAIVISTYAPTITTGANISVTPSTLVLVLATFAPSVVTTANRFVTPTTLSLTLTSFSPTVIATSSQSVTPSTASLTLTTFAPAVSVLSGVTVFPNPASLTLTTYAPTVIRSTTPRDYYINDNGDVFWVLSEEIGLIMQVS